MTDNKPRNNPTSQANPAGVAAPAVIIYLSTVTRGGVKYWRLWDGVKIEEIPAVCRVEYLVEMAV